MNETEVSSDEELEYSSLSSLSEEDVEDEEEDEELEDEEEDENGAGPSIRYANKVAITPRKNNGESSNGRPMRRSAAAASNAWLGSREAARRQREESSIDANEERAEGTPKKRGRPPLSSTSTPTKRADEAATDTLRKRGKPPLMSSPAKGGVEVEVSTPKKRGRPPLNSTPSKKDLVAEGSEGLELTPRKRGRPPLGTTTPRKEVGIEDTPRKRGRPPLSSKHDEDESRNPFTTGTDGSMIRPSSSDAYFVNHATRATSSARLRTSDNLISRDISALAPRTIVSMTKRLAKVVESNMDDKGKEGSLQVSFPTIVPLSKFDDFHQHWWSLLQSTSRPLLFYGIGSKRAPLQRFAHSMAQTGRCSVIVIRGDAGGKVEEAIQEMERTLSISPYSDISRLQRAMSANAMEARVLYLLKVLERTQSEASSKTPPAFMLMLHTIDSPALLQERSMRLLGLLCTSPYIHVCADTIHFNVASLAGLDENLPWLWIDLTTYIPILDEIIGERGAGIGRTIGLPPVLDIRRAGADSDVAVLAMDHNRVGQSQLTARNGTGADQDTPAVGPITLLSDRAAIHILRSVTFKARGLFLLLGGRLINTSKSTTQLTADTEELKAITYDDLSELARNNFLAMTPDALRALLVEFTSHGLVSIVDNRVQIALTKSDLQHVIDSFSKQAD
ncbi:uncharacterized protein FA14DRAFT_78495 [Meira miltonrushii]|uniref:Origin recognition complex subunit 2 n=1 Tax=Meira miltonrushii TaxID=1280837 RepID=A0A316V8M0_9BASI|nr:uncharacterized protein FA14DRAFT_78495 [Meira miltonrushii]PWN32831.1 hypothetical protein FA14DRAFT_78495 [Meira miltonrushii]